MNRKFSSLLNNTLLLTSILVLTLGLTVCAEPEAVKDILNRAPSVGDYPDSDAVIMLDKGVVEVGVNGQETITITKRIKVFNKEGRKKFGEVKIPYVARWGKPKTNYIRTTTPRGEVVEPDEDDIRDVTPTNLQRYPMYSDVKNRVISMPGLQNGAIIDYSYTLVPKRFFLRDDFASSWLFRSTQPVIKSCFQVKFPPDMGVEWTDFGAGSPPVVTETGDRLVYTWVEKDLPRIVEQPAMPPVSSISDRVLISSVDSWDYYAREFWKLMKNRIEPDDPIKRKVKELTEGLKSDGEKIHALYNYVATKIRYVGIELGRGRIQPHKARDVFRNKYGDCKDKATLLISMLGVAGLEAYPVLILAGLNEKTDFEQPPPGRGINHVIVAVDEGGGFRFLDPTCDVCPYNYLPVSSRGKKVLVIVPREGVVKKIVETDQFSPGDSIIQVTRDVNIDRKGNLETNIEISHTGYYSYYLKFLLGSYSQVRQEQIYRGLLSQLESGARLVEFDHSNLGDVDERLTINLAYEKKGYADRVGNSLVFKTPSALRIPLSRDYGESVSLPGEERNYPLQIVPAVFGDKVVISFPEGREIIAPPGVYIDTEWASYRSSYEKSDGNRVIVTRKFVKRKPSVSVEGYPEFRRLVNVMRNDQKSTFEMRS